MDIAKSMVWKAIIIKVVEKGCMNYYTILSSSYGKIVENSRQKKSYKVCEKARKTSLTRYAIALFQVSIEGLIRCNQIASIQSKTEDTISNHVRDDKRDVFCWKCHLGHLSAMDQWVRKIAAPFLSIFPKQIRSSSFH